jgi:hypothetical protein
MLAAQHAPCHHCADHAIAPEAERLAQGKASGHLDPGAGKSIERLSAPQWAAA